MKIYDNMKAWFLALAVVLLAFLKPAGLFAQEQQKPMDVYQMAEAEADRLQRALGLEDWQVFYVDSTLKHNYPAMVEESDKLRAAKVSNMNMYFAVQDKWMEKIDEAYKKIFNPQQWAAYLKSGAAKAQKAREKRKAKAEALNN